MVLRWTDGSFLFFFQMLFFGSDTGSEVMGSGSEPFRDAWALVIVELMSYRR